MAADKEKKKARMYLGVDVGGTKIQASLVDEGGMILRRKRFPTPRDGGPEPVLAQIEEAIEAVVQKDGLRPGELTAVGLRSPAWSTPTRVASSSRPT